LHPKVWLHLGLAIEMTWLAMGGTFLSLLARIELESSILTLYGLHFQHSRPIFELWHVGILESLNGHYYEFKKKGHFFKKQ